MKLSESGSLRFNPFSLPNLASYLQLYEIKYEKRQQQPLSPDTLYWPLLGLCSSDSHESTRLGRRVKIEIEEHFLHVSTKCKIDSNLKFLGIPHQAFLLKKQDFWIANQLFHKKLLQNSDSKMTREEVIQNDSPNCYLDDSNWLREYHDSTRIGSRSISDSLEHESSSKSLTRAHHYCIVMYRKCGTILPHLPQFFGKRVKGPNLCN